MSRSFRALHRATLIGCVALVTSGLCVARASAQESVSIELPLTVTFPVFDVTTSTTGEPGPSTVHFSAASLATGHAFQVSVQSTTSDFSAPSGPAIPASKVSWTVGSASGGTGLPGTLSSTSWGLVFRSQVNPISGGVDVTWALAAPGSGTRAGNHSLTIRWKLESITP